MSETNTTQSNTKLLRVVVVGAGVIGLTAVVHLLDRFPGKLDLTLVADKFSPDTLSDKSVALLWPVVTDESSSMGNQVEDMKRWFCTSLNKFQSIFRSSENALAQVSLVHGYGYFPSPQFDPWWRDVVHGARLVKMESAEAKLLVVPVDCVEIWTFGTYIVNPTCFLQWLMKKAKDGGCKMEKKRLSSFDELTSSYDVVINCTGLGSHQMLSDQRTYPVRGQTVVVKAPWVKHWVSNESDIHTTIIPRGSVVMLGGTHEVGDWNEATDPDTASAIIKRCQELVPSLCGAEVVGGWVGLRPGRDQIRLEGCEGPGGSMLIHCYGHEGKGFILSWGCAVDIGDMVEKKLSS